MEKIEEVIERTVKDTHISYKAIDGTLFTDENECRRYEETAEAVLLAKLSEIQIKEISCDDLFESGEGVYRVVIPTNEKHIDTLNQLWKLNGGASQDKLIFDSSYINTVVLVGVRIYDSKIDWIWFYKLNDVIDDITSSKYKLSKNK